MNKCLFQFVKIILILFSLLLIEGCTVFSVVAKNSPGYLSASAKEYLQKAASAEGAEQQNYQLLAIDQMLTDNNVNDAQQLLGDFAIPLNPRIASQKLILKAQLALKMDKPLLAIRALHKISNPKILPIDIQIAYYSAAISAHERNNNPAYGIIARISLNSLIQDKELQRQNKQIIWHKLQTLPASKLTELLSRSRSNLLRGWLELAIIAKQYANSPKELAAGIKVWEKAYPEHCVNDLLPNDEVLEETQQFAVPAQIALLLPLSGSFSGLGDAVRDGFMTAFYSQSKALINPPNIKIYDTSENASVIDLYQQAVSDGAQFIIGPLTKKNVEKLAESGNISVPTLALNYLPDDTSSPERMVFFGLSPEQSAKQSAEQAFQRGVSKVLVIIPDTEWGNNIKQSFLTEWQNLGGQVVDSLSYGDEDNLTQKIADVLNINLSKNRADKLNKILGKSLKFTPRRRQDLNGIFLIATPSKARQINPLLRFYYAGDLPVFSISSIYGGYFQRNLDQDLNNIFFNDMPWLLTNDKFISDYKNKIKALWGNSYRKNNRMYALGVDTYTLSLLYWRLTAMPSFAINGVTGVLFLHEKQIYRKLLPAQFRNGIPAALS